jgi:HK97 family phage major capsid protein
MWIIPLQDFGPYKKDQQVELKDEVKAKNYVDDGLAKTGVAPVDPTLPDLIATTVKTELASQFKTHASKFRDVTDPDATADQPAKAFKIPAEVKKYCSLRKFKGPNADERAYRFGMYLLGLYASSGRIADPERQEHMNRSLRKCKALGIQIKQTGFMNDQGELTEAQVKASNENTNISSAFLVPDEFGNDLIDLREKFGVFRQNAKIVPMSSDTRSDPRRRSGVTSYFVGEDLPGLQSVKNWDRVRLTAKKLMVLSKYSNELNEDAVMNIGDDLAGEIAYEFALKEDQCGFTGDGSSTYGGIVGCQKALLNVDPVIGNILGLVVASGTGSWAGNVLGDFNKVVGILPEYADDDAKWYVSKTYWGQIMQRLATAAGGNRVGEITGGARTKEFLGYEVVVSQVMPKTWATNQVVALFGSLRRAAELGDRRMTSLSVSDVALNSFEQDEIAVRGTERFDINVHDVGESSATSTANARDPRQGTLPGPLVGLVTAST